MFARLPYSLKAKAKRSFVLRLDHGVLKRLREARGHTLQLRVRATTAGVEVVHRFVKPTLA